MHPRSIYKDNPPDFRELAIKYPYFREHFRENTSGSVSIDFKDPAALRALTCALLENDFDLRIEIPLDRLIPTVPLRLNYILWIEDLVECLAGRESQTDVIGVDIGMVLWTLVYLVFNHSINQSINHLFNHESSKSYKTSFKIRTCKRDVDKDTTDIAGGLDKRKPPPGLVDLFFYSLSWEWLKTINTAIEV